DGERRRSRRVDRALGSDQIHDGRYRVVETARVQDITVTEVPDCRLHRGRLLIQIGQRGGLVRLGVELAQDAGHEADVRPVRGGPRAEGVSEPGPCQRPNVDAVELELSARIRRGAVNDASETLVLGREAGRWGRGVVLSGGVETARQGSDRTIDT